jgi:hypothetical protein
MAMFLKPVVVSARIQSIPIRGSGSRPFGKSGFRSSFCWATIKNLTGEKELLFLFKKQYFYSEASLREFQATEEESSPPTRT